jgi:hypothetical protein
MLDTQRQRKCFEFESTVLRDNSDIHVHCFLSCRLNDDLKFRLPRQSRRSFVQSWLLMHLNSEMARAPTYDRLSR